MNYRSNETLQDVADMLRQSSRVLITTHAKPDGDAFGSVLAMTLALRQMGKEVFTYLMPPVPQSFTKLEGGELLQVYNGETQLPQVDLVLVLDTGAWSQLEPMRAVLSPQLNRMLIVDHHLNGDVEAAHRHIDGQAAACCEMVAMLLDELDDAPSDPAQTLYTRALCAALFIGIASDTGWFRFSNTRPCTHELAARLLRCGVDHAQLHQQLEQTERPAKLKLMVRVLESLQLLANGRAAVMVLSADDFAQTGASLHETERFVDIPQAVETVQLVVLITEPPVQPDAEKREPVRLSFRSKPGDLAINVAKLAEQFGGGGHARAAGGKVDAPLEQVIAEVTKAVIEAVS